MSAGVNVKHKPLNPLLRRIPKDTSYPEYIHPMESLDSLFWRLCHKNLYEHLGYITEILPDPPVRHPKLNLIRAQAHYQALAELNLVDSETIYSLTLHPFAPVFERGAAYSTKRNPPQYRLYTEPFWSRIGATNHMRYPRTQMGDAVCPRCWAEQSVVLLPWSLLPVTTCPVHQVLLVDTCPVCEIPLRLSYQKGACRWCETPVIKFPTFDVSGHAPSEVLTSLVWRALEGHMGVSLPGASFSQVEHPLSSMSGADVLYFLWHFAQLLARRDPGNPIFALSFPGSEALPSNWDPHLLWEQSRGIPLEDLHRIMAGMGQMVLDWPHSWHGELERLAVGEGVRMNNGRLPQILARDYANPKWGWLRDSWDEFMRENLHKGAVRSWLHYYRAARRSAGDGDDVLSPRQASKRVGVRVETIKRLIDKGFIEATPRVGAGSVGRRPYRVTLVKAEALEEYKRMREAHLTLVQVRRRLGLKESTVRGLVRSGILPLSRSAYGNQKWVSVEAIEGLLQRLSEMCPVRGVDPEDSERVSLREAVRIGFQYSVTLALLLEEILAGELPAYRQRDELRLWELWVQRWELQEYLRRSFAPDGKVLLSKLEVVQVLGTRYEFVNRWRDVGLLVPVFGDGRRKYGLELYDAADVEDFRHRYINSVDGARILGCSSSTLQELARAGNVREDCVAYTPDEHYGGWLFDRDALQDWAADRITVEEVAEILGSHPETVRMWGRQGRLSRVSNIWYSRREVAEWRDDRISTREAAELVGVSLQSFIAWVNAGRFAPVATVGRNNKWWYFSKRELTAWRAERMTGREVMATLGITRGQLDTWVANGKLLRLSDGYEGMLWVSRESVERLRTKGAA